MGRYAPHAAMPAKVVLLASVSSRCAGSDPTRRRTRRPSRDPRNGARARPARPRGAAPSERSVPRLPSVARWLPRVHCRGAHGAVATFGSRRWWSPSPPWSRPAAEGTRSEPARRPVSRRVHAEIQSPELLPATHIPAGEKATYNTTPPSSGNHYARPAQVGGYTEPIKDETQVHNLEHGHVMIQYRGITTAQITELGEVVLKTPRRSSSRPTRTWNRRSRSPRGGRSRPATPGATRSPHSSSTSSASTATTPRRASTAERAAPVPSSPGSRIGPSRQGGPMAVKHKPDGYNSVTPYVIVEDAAEVIDFLA